MRLTPVLWSNTCLVCILLLCLSFPGVVGDGIESRENALITLQKYAASNATLVHVEGSRLQHKVRYGMLLNNVLRRFPDRYTFSAWGQVHTLSTKLSDVLLQPEGDGKENKKGDVIVEGDMLPSLVDHHSHEALVTLGTSPFLSSAPVPIFSSEKLHVGKQLGGGVGDAAAGAFVNMNYVWFAGHFVLAWRCSHSTFRLAAVKLPLSSTKNDSYEWETRHLRALVEDPIQHRLFWEGGLEYTGEDPRLFLTGTDNKSEVEQRLWIVFCRRHRHQKPELSMAFSSLVLAPTSRTFPSPSVDLGSTSASASSSLMSVVLLSKVLNMQLPSRYKGQGKDFRKANQKNWSPLDYRGWPAFIAQHVPVLIFVAPVGPTLNELLVYEQKALEAHMRYRNRNNVTELAARAPEGVNILVRTLSRTTVRNSKWPHSYGEMRGGTPALRVRNTNSSLQDDDYTGSEYFLTFFHSSSDPSSHAAVEGRGQIRFTPVLKTYFIGALLLSIKPPFDVCKMTVKPIVHPQMYTGEWALSSAGGSVAFHHMDYIVFPTNFALYGDVLRLQYGWQDKHTWVVDMSLQALLNSMQKAEQGGYDIPVDGE